MSGRPVVSPLVIAEIVSAAPARLRRKLDKQPQIANEWDWNSTTDGWQISTGNETVALEGQVEITDHVRCSCLLSPRCFHVLAVLSVLDIDDAPVDEPTPESSQSHDEETQPEQMEIADAQRDAANQLWKAAASVLAVGLRAAGTLLQAELLRAVHECRCQGLHRLAAAGMRVMQDIRLLRNLDAAFSTDAAHSDLTELLRCGWRIIHSDGTADSEWIGTARRKYEPIANQRLTGLFTEPILTRSGFAGVLTYLMAEDGSLGTISNVRAGTESRIFDAWQTGAEFGQLSTSHEQLNRATVLVQKATRSKDGRLGGGKDCRAVVVDGSGWDTPKVAERWAVPIHEQIERCFQHESHPETHRPAGWDFVFARGVILGGNGEELLFQPSSAAVPLWLTIAQDQSPLMYRTNIVLLSRCQNLPVRCVVRVDLAKPGTASILAISSDPLAEESDCQLKLPEEFRRTVSLGIEELKRGHLTSATRTPTLRNHSFQMETRPDGLEALRRCLRGLLLGGRHAIPTGRLPELTRNVRRLEIQKQPMAASLLGTLARSATASQTDFEGIRFPNDPSPLAETYLAASCYEMSARRHFEQDGWRQLDTQ
ncbi:hypothetical protein [Thalassoroseus pseudoceratinae]|uniref:hypothetical protein n=1 Tax=Thalassoroseus pseudoceratinae TaxID=2713176 RepID=UPI0014243F3D|nr:hypothetical protein [Thalassoroseus pseudoceratinae]